jgi:hypothetical protein
MTISARSLLFGLARNGEFVEPDQRDSTCPVPLCKNIFLPACPKSNLYPPPSRPTEGRIMIVAYAGRDAVDAGGAKDESADPPSLKLRRTGT